MSLSVESLFGIVASGKGIIEGEVVVLEDSSQDIGEGKILVTHITDPTFFSQILKSSALITDVGGVLCHASILARELSKPCIVGTNRATEVLKTGDKVRINLENGEITKIE